MSSLSEISLHARSVGRVCRVMADKNKRGLPGEMQAIVRKHSVGNRCER